MHIKELIIDGFKSYATRTVISGFDPQFNAITGLNGSGKSNILDAICFVLGLSTLSLARVNSLQELVYKFGHAGITKASVSLVFDNRDKSNSPAGFEEVDTIVVTRMISAGKSKYLLNGHNETNQKIKMLFKTVGLNIDNPHFLVAQGRITKVINLRPSELISMLEETAGTSLYNEKKRESQRIIEKKEEKVREMNDLLKKEIEPQMEKLRKEKENFYTWKSGEIELEKLNKRIRAYDYFMNKRAIEERNVEINHLKTVERDQMVKIKKNEDGLKKIQKELEDYKSQKNVKAFETFRELEKECFEAQKEIQTLDNETGKLKEKIKDSEADQERCDLSITELQAAISRIDHKMKFSDGNIEKQIKTLKEKKNMYEEAKRNLQALQKGDEVLTDNNVHSLSVQLKEAELNLNSTLSEIKQLEMKLQHLRNELKSQQASLENNQKDSSQLNEVIHNLTEEFNRLQAKYQKLDISQDQYAEMQDEKKSLQHDANEINNRIQNIGGMNPIFRLNFRDPEPNFDRRKVKGRVFQLISVNDSKFIKPLEAIAGGKLYQVIVDNENTSKMLLKRESFGQTHVILIPNNKVVAQQIPSDTIERARQIAAELQGNAAPAYTLIKYDPEIKNSVEFVFGGAFICSSTEIAKRIAFDKNIRRKCVNLEGDIFDPAGTLSGGYQNSQNSILTKFAEFKKLNHELDATQKGIKTIEDKLTKIQEKMYESDKLKSDIEMKSHELDLAKKRLKDKTGFKVQERAEDLELQIRDLEEQINDLRDQESSYQRELTELKKEKANFGKGEAKNKEFYTDQVDKLKKEVERIEGTIRNMKTDKSNNEVEKENNENEIQRKNKELSKEQERMENFKKELNQKEKVLSKLKSESTKKEEEKRKLDKQISSMDTKIKSSEEQIAKLNTEKENLDKEIKRMENLINRYTKEIKDSQERVRNLEKNFPWLLQEYESFGLNDSEYDFDGMDVEQEESNFHKLKKDQEAMAKRVNMKVEAMSDKVENEFKGLIEKRQILLGDKNTLYSNIEELDKKKKEALEKCWVEVNENFGKIFSSLLPGAFAKLQPLKDKELTDGLELKVAFNNAWKNSLSELSGGQRSLLAFSFLLALLLFKPAPFYILDEIDAALDLSHTENIGNMISEHFPQAQFIIISLKEGMYSHANILFKTSFVDGISKVDRIQLKNKR